MFDLFCPGLLAGVLLTLSTGPLGCFIVWRRMSSFGDTLSHSSILGLSISIALHLNAFYIILVFTILLAILLAWLKEFSSLSLETILSIISHSALSLGMVLISLISKNQLEDIHRYFFGNLLTVDKYDLIVIFLVDILVISILLYRWNSLLSVTINEELAKIDGVNLYYDRLIIMLTIAITMSLSMNFFGSLLVTSLLIIPPSIAQNFSQSPEKMVVISIIFSIISVLGGISFSFFYNTPVSPSIVLFSSIFYFFSNIKKFFLY